MLVRVRVLSFAGVGRPVLDADVGSGPCVLPCVLHWYMPCALDPDDLRCSCLVKLLPDRCRVIELRRMDEPEVLRDILCTLDPDVLRRRADPEVLRRRADPEVLRRMRWLLRPLLLALAPVPDRLLVPKHSIIMIE